MRLTCALTLTLASAALVTACSDATSPDRPPLAVSMGLAASTGAGSVLVTDVGGLSVRVPAAQSKDVRAPRLGEVPVRAALVSASGDTLARVDFVHHFARGAQHWIAGAVAARRPVGICIGAQVAAAVRGSAVDSLFVAYGSIPDGATC